MNEKRCLSAGFICLLFAALPLAPEAGQPDRAGAAKWVARYNGPGDAEDRAWAMAVDGAGNVVVTGQSYGGWHTGIDFATVKYSPAGKRLWVQRYDGSNSRDDHAWAVAVDAASNVFVTGTTNLDNGTFILTVKYGPDGKRLWVQRYDDGVNDTCSAGAVAVDAAGNAYVAGEVWNPGSATNCDAIIIKYSPSGKKIWAKTYNGAANGWDGLSEIETDGAGNVYAAGNSWGSGTSSDYVTLKLNANGKLVWAKRYDGPGSRDDRVSALAVDAAGNVYVTGESRADSVNVDYATLKYDPAGNPLWVQRYDGPGKDADQAAALDVDGAGNVYVTGISDGAAGDADAATVKYGPNGEQVWVRRYNGSGRSDDYAEALALDKSGNVLVTGQSYGSGTSYDYVTIKY